MIRATQIQSWAVRFFRALIKLAWFSGVLGCSAYLGILGGGFYIRAVLSLPSFGNTTFQTIGPHSEVFIHEYRPEVWSAMWHTYLPGVVIKDMSNRHANTSDAAHECTPHHDGIQGAVALIVPTSPCDFVKQASDAQNAGAAAIILVCDACQVEAWSEVLPSIPTLLVSEGVANSILQADYQSFAVVFHLGVVLKSLTLLVAVALMTSLLRRAAHTLLWIVHRLPDSRRLRLLAQNKGNVFFCDFHRLEVGATDGYWADSCVRLITNQHTQSMQAACSVYSTHLGGQVLDCHCSGAFRGSCNDSCNALCTHVGFHFFGIFAWFPFCSHYGDC